MGIIKNLNIMAEENNTPNNYTSELNVSGLTDMSAAPLDDDDMLIPRDGSINEDRPAEYGDGGATKRDSLGTREVAAYAVGHVNNDLCACMWFVYLPWYLTNVVDLDPNITGLCLLSGQITDGITTPIVGYLSDKVNCPGGRRNFWYYFGFTFVNITFLGIFTNPPFIQDASEKVRNIWYLTMPAIFNVGWASV